ncbi:MAG: DUF3618 domain-containing protein [Pseudomonadota bacterium]
MENTDNRSPDQIQRDIKRTQDDMSRTVDKIGDQFTMRNLVNALFDKAEENDVQARKLIDGARRNPLALGLISAGAIWLASDHEARPGSFRSGDRNNSDADDKSWREKLSEKLPDFDDSHERDHRAYVDHMNLCKPRDNEDDTSYQRRRDYARGTFLMIERRHNEDDAGYRQRLDEATEKLRTKRDEMAERARTAREDATRRMQSASEQAKQRASQGADRITNTYQQNPVIGGLAAALIGMIAGSAAPATAREREVFGDVGEDMVETARQKAQDMGEKARAKKDELVEKADNKVAPGKSDTTPTGSDLTTSAKTERSTKEADLTTTN